MDTPSSLHLLRIPRQERARATVDALLEATALLLVEQGWDTLTTNRVAERAGVSIGTLYQYFANKDALVGLLFERFIEEQLGMLREELATLLAEDFMLEDAVARLMRVVMSGHRAHPALSRALFMQVSSSAHTFSLSAITASATEMIAAGLEASRDELRPGLETQLAAHIIVTSMHGVIYTSLLDRPDWFADDCLADELTRLVLGYIRPLSPAAGPDHMDE